MAREFPELARRRARQMRTDATDPEAIFWSHVRNRLLNGHKFRRQVPIGPYIVDFLCADKKLIVELDGFQHAEDPRDEIRDRYLSSLGYRILRFWNQEIYADVGQALVHVVEVLEDRA
ncbi:MAG: endonuclease domain-containing protein [Allorhizobium sp.]